MNNQEHNSKKELLFHYTKFDTALFYILPDMCIRLNPIIKMNDIYEQKVSLDNYIEDILERIFIKQAFENFKSKIKIGCFVRDLINKRGFDNQMMWNFYGENYKGICLVLDKQNLIKEICKLPKRIRKQQKIKYKFADPFKFDRDELKIKGFSVDDLNKNHFPKIQSENNKKIWDFLTSKSLIQELFFRKNKQWSNEMEYRFLVFDESDKFDLKIKDSLIAVIVGPYFDRKTDKNKMDFLNSLGKNNNFKVYNSDYDRYNNKIIPIKPAENGYDQNLHYASAFLNEENL